MFEPTIKMTEETPRIDYDYQYEYNGTGWWNITSPDLDAYDPKLYKEWNMALLLGRYVPPVLLIVGTVLNALTMVVLGHKRMRMAVPVVYMQFLLISCTIALHVAVLPGCMRHLNLGEFTTMNAFSCKFYVYMSYFSTDIPAWVLVSCALHQVAGIILPEWTTKSVSRCRAALGVSLIAIVLFLINMPMAIISKLFTWKSMDGTIKLCASEVHGTMKVFIKNFWPWMDFAMFAALPSLVLTFTTTIFIIHLISIRRQRTETSYVPCYYATRMIPTLISLSANFILMTSPICVNILFIRFGPKFTSTFQLAQNYLWYTLGTISQYLFYSSCFFPFLLSPNFRYELCRIVCPCSSNVLKEAKVFPVEVDSSAEKINKVFVDDGAAGTEV